LYVQISDAIRAMIHSGELGPDSILPPSKLLCEKFGITRMTLRQAYAVLDREGLVDAQRGRGTFVRRPRIERTLSQMIGFSEEMLARGKKPSSRVLTFEQTSPTDTARQFLGERPVFRIERLLASLNNCGAPEFVESAESTGVVQTESVREVSASLSALSV